MVSVAHHLKKRRLNQEIKISRSDLIEKCNQYLDGQVERSDIENYALTRPIDSSNVCEIMLSIRYEKEWNSKRNTDVVFTYPLNVQEQ